MKPNYILLLSCILFVCLASTSEAQILKKIKDKVNKKLNTGDKTEEEESSSSSKEKDNTAKWCDTELTAGGGVGKDGVEYTLAYSSPGAMSIVYEESSLSLENSPKGYRLILTERVNNKQQFVVVENGKVVDTDKEVKPQYLPKRSSQNSSDSDVDPSMSKYIVGDTLKQDIKKMDAQSVTIQKMDEDQFEMAMAIARETDDYKNMSADEKKEFEATTKAGLAAYNSKAGTTINTQAHPGGTLAMVTGYLLIVKGKNYGKFMTPPVIDVSNNETNVFAVGVTENAEPVMIANGKKINLDKNVYQGMSGKIIRSPDRKKFVYMEAKKMSDKELQSMLSASGNGQTKMAYNVLRGDGTSMTVTDYNSSGVFKLTNSGVLVAINESTGEVYGDNKVIGKFSMKDNDRINSQAALIGSDVTKIAYYNGEEGSLTYLDGTVKKMDIMFPKVIFENGKSYLSWFRKCRNDVYIAKFAY